MANRCWNTIVLRLCLGIGLLITIAGPCLATATDKQNLSPMQTLRERIDRMIALLNDPELSKPGGKAVQRNRIWEISRPMFDFTEISRRTVGQKWEIFSDEEKKRFIEIFSEFLANTYIDKIQGEYHNEKIAYEKELVRENQALVRTKLMRANAEIPIDYRMKLEGTEWKIYDILVENGVSLVQNYRVQFQSILQKETPAQLIARLEIKLKEQQTPSGK